MPEWVQLLHGVPGQYLHAVTAHLFKHGQPEPDFQWIRGYQTGPDEEKDDDSFESMFEGLVPTVTPAGSHKRTRQAAFLGHPAQTYRQSTSTQRSVHRKPHTLAPKLRGRKEHRKSKFCPYF